MYRNNRNKDNEQKDHSLLEGEERHHFKKMKDILEDFPNKGPPSVPSQLLPHLYIGSLRNAEDLNMLQRLNISHVLNMAGTRQFDLTKSPYPKEIGIKEYLMIPAEDHDCYNIVQHFIEANAFINKAKRIGGKALVHCNLGVNRCGAVCAAYLLIEERLPLLEVLAFLKKKRAVVLCNNGFRRQILRYALARGLVEKANNGSRFCTLGTISKYLVTRPTARPEIDRQKERMKESENARRREQERLSERASRNTESNGHATGNGVSNEMIDDHVNGTNSYSSGERKEEVKENNIVNPNGNHYSSASNGVATEEDEEVASLVNHAPKISRFLPRNSSIYSPEPTEEAQRPYSPTRPFGKLYNNDIGSSSSKPYMEFGTSFRTRPYQRSYSANIESESNRCMSPNYDDIPENAESSVKFRARRSKFEMERPATVCSDYTKVDTSFKSRYASKKPFNVEDSDDDLESEYTPLINMFHLENLDKSKGVKYGSSSFQAMSFSSSEPNLLEKNAKLKNYVHIRPYAPSLEFVGRKTVTSGTSSSSGHYSSRRYSSIDVRPHSVYTDRPYSATSVSSSTAHRPLSCYKSSANYKGYSPDILPSYNATYSPPSRSYSSFSLSSSSYGRGPISSATSRNLRNFTSPLSDYPRSYSSM